MTDQSPPPAEKKPATPPRRGKKPGPKKKTKAEKEEAAWYRAIAKLPNSAPGARELNWIRNHPAMGRLSRNKMKGSIEKVVLKVEDIKDAPSQAAVQSLQHWANNPDEFHKMILQEQRKATSVANDGSFVDETDELPEIKAIDELLMSLDGAVQVTDDDSSESDEES